MTIKNNNEFTFIDLCAGIGGFRIGLEALGGDCVYSAEWNKFARLTYETNFGGTVEGHDVNEIIPNERRGLVREFADFIVHNKAWWMTPIIVVVAVMVALILFIYIYTVLTFIYTVI